MKANKKNSYEKVEASIKLHLLCIQMLFILGLVIEGQTCPDLKEFKTSILRTILKIFFDNHRNCRINNYF